MTHNDRLFGKRRQIGSDCHNWCLLKSRMMEARKCLIHDSVVVEVSESKVVRIMVCNETVLTKFLRRNTHDGSQT